MITKFLYELDEKNRRIVSSIVENESFTELLPSYPMIEQTTYKKNEDDIITPNSGEMVYVVFEIDGIKKYLDVNVFKTEVKIALTDKISHAACIGKQMALIILYNYDYFELDDSKIVPSGFYKGKNGLLKDKYDNFFSKANDETHCQIRKNEEVFFVSKDENRNYCLNKDFSKATRIDKSDVRKILTINDFIDEQTKKQDISFSKYNCFSNGKDYLFAGAKPIRLSLSEDNLIIDTKETEIFITDRIINNEEVFKRLKELFFKLAEPTTNKFSYLDVNGDYVKKTEFGYSLVKSPFEATLLDLRDSDIFKLAYQVFHSDAVFKKFSKDANFVYYDQNDTFIFSNKPMVEYQNGLIVEKSNYDRFVNNFNAQVTDSNEGVIVIKDKKYLKFKYINQNKINVSWLDSAYDATILAETQVNALVGIFNWDIKKREIKNIIKDGNIEQFNIVYSNKNQDILQDYEKFLGNVLNSKHRMCSFNEPSSIKIESEKGAIEYLRRFYIKNIYDTAKLFEIVLTNYTVKNILIVGSGSNIDLIGLNETCKQLDKEVNVTTIDKSTWGFYPHISLSKKVNYNKAYRFEFCNVVSSIIDNYDMILFNKGFDESTEDIAPLLKSITNSNKNIIIANLKHCNLEKKNDSIFDYFKEKFDLNRKFFNHDEESLSKYITLSKNALSQLKIACRCQKSECDACDPVVLNKNSYHSIIVKENLKIRDHYRKKAIY